MSGRTRQGKLVHVPAGPGVHAGAYLQVRIGQAAPHWLAAHARPRIPVAAG
jgi:hypothetical protein